MPRLTEAQRAEIGERCEKATDLALPVSVEHETSPFACYMVRLVGHNGYPGTPILATPFDSDACEADAELAAHARQDIPALLDDLKFYTEATRLAKEWSDASQAEGAAMKNLGYTPPRGTLQDVTNAGKLTAVRRKAFRDHMEKENEL